uniref:Leucine-rich repeat protein n=1 Tax=viral metagenome TaxID=1070528 RepID=A0A6C0EBG6_9ZZZZ
MGNAEGKVVNLSVTYDDIKNKSIDLKQFTGLNALSVDFCGNTIYKDFFNGLENISYLCIKNAKKIHSQAFVGLTKLVTLIIEYSHIPPCFPLQFPCLKELSINNCKLKEIPRMALPDLKTLSLANNKITSVDKEHIFRDVPKLTKLYLNSNRIYEIGYTVFKNTPDLQVLGLNDNYLDEVPVAAFYCSKLEELYCQENMISDFHVMKEFCEKLSVFKY